MAGAGVVIGLGVYYAVHHGHSLRGCASSGADGLQLANEGDGRTYELTGETAAVKPGERERVSGKKSKGDTNRRQFAVSKVSKDYGACRAKTATP